MTKCEECEIEVSNIEFIQDQHSCFETMKKKLREQKEEIQDFKILSGDIITPYHFYMKIRRTELQKIQTDMRNLYKNKYLKPFDFDKVIRSEWN